MCTKKINVAVIFGGCSSEYGVSLASAASAIDNINQEKFNVIMLGITREGDWYCFKGDTRLIAKDEWLSEKHCKRALLSPNRSKHEVVVLDGEKVEYIPIDVALPILHGKNGEDGSVQGTLSVAGIPNAGCEILASALCMDKDRAHKLVAKEGIRSPKAIVLSDESEPVSVAHFVKEVGFPVFVKPVKAGSSYGITKVKKEEELNEAIHNAFEYDDEVIIEEFIDGFEVGCAILGNRELLVGEVDEIELSDGFFDYTEKYTLQSSYIHVPARIDEETTYKVKEAARRIYRALSCSGFARVDMFLTSKMEIVFNEVNTIPGFTEHSRYPGMMKAAGISFQEVLTRIIEQAVEA